ncbi:TetR/AcrR family transcriptional regulator [Actinoplanes sp. NBRC 103695]|uniref:TetR/AcrR family transcriptional regulator n=1 Tax=Actinoplanes sp. NBRC 103695 TaxID=3032202 RepID=UPI00255720E0|nr:TetR/AcrR family transcriptional regulator [Actinoplanes sp. NBRC 103695]
MNNSRERRRAETHEAILSAAYDLFCAKGYAECSVAEIAAAAGFTKGAVYGTYESKEDLFLALTETRTSLLAAEAAAIWEAAKPPLHPLRALAAWMRERLQQDRDWFLVNVEFSALAARRPHLRARRRAALSGSVDEIARIFQIGSTRGGASAARSVSHAVLALADGLALQYAMDDTIDVELVFAESAWKLLRAETGANESDRP